MLYFDFKNYDGFKERFGLIDHGNGVKSRRNKILLAFVKNQEFLRECRNSWDFSLLNLTNLVELKNVLMQKIQYSSSHMRLPYHLNLLNYSFRSSIYSTDESNGLCEDGDPNCIRYMNHENNDRIFKMKAGKLFRAVVLESKFGKTLPEQVLVYLMEQFSLDWQSYTIGQLPQNRLYVNDNFRRIYDSDECVGNFHSCMVDEEFHTFYSDAVEAKAAYLENEDGKIIARCIIYTHCIDESGKVWRLAERQYATDESLVLKKALIDQLIAGGHIDGYKKVGADCRSPKMFLDIYGNSLENKKFKIRCNLETDDTVSYQDSFKWYHYGRGEAYNHDSVSWSYFLDITSGSIDESEQNDEDNDDPDCWDEYHQRYCYSTTTVFHNGAMIECDSDDLDDFTWIETLQEYHHNDDICVCPVCGSYFVKRHGRHSDILDADYCNEECLEKSEKDFKKEHWTYSSFEDEYFEDPSAVTTFMEWTDVSYATRTISTRLADLLLMERSFHRIGNKLYHQINAATGMPYFELCAA